MVGFLFSARDDAGRWGRFADDCLFLIDIELGKLLEVLDEYTVITFSDPNEFKPYEPEFSSEQPVHMDLKRWSESELLSRKDGNSTSKSLFEKYQFFTPGELPCPKETSFVVFFFLKKKKKRKKKMLTQ